MATDKVSVQVAYALPNKLWQCRLQLSAGSTVNQALEASGFWQAHPSLNPKLTALGVYGLACDTNQVLKPGDRIEIYRPLVFDPMESRRRRALHRKAFMTKPPNRPKRRKARLAAMRLGDAS